MDIGFLGIPKTKENQLRKKGLETIEDLASFYPRKYYDFREITPIRNLRDDDIKAVIGTLREISVKGKMVRAKIVDQNTRAAIFIVWFGQPYIAKTLQEDEDYIFCGKVIITEGYPPQMVNPILYSDDIYKYREIYPIYSKVKGMSDDYLRGVINSSLEMLEKDEKLEDNIIQKFQLLKKIETLREIHNPTERSKFSQARKRLIFDDLFHLAIELENVSSELAKESSFVVKEDKILREVLASLPFELTDGQRQVMRSLFIQMKKGERVNALVQGDVGSGKTIIAILLMVMAAENNFQSAIMAPTNILAKQHYEELVKIIEPLGFKAVFLSGDMKVKEKRETLKEIKEGTAHIVVGTHAIISKSVEYQKLGLTIVDEEHRFGVVQRNSLKEKAKAGVHSLVMSATPIPRTLAMTVHGEGIDVHTITTMPKGRKPIQTKTMTNNKEVYHFMHEEIKSGRQCYIVCPLIEESDSEIMQGVLSVEEVFEEVREYFKDAPEVKIAMINGKMKQADVQEEINKFSKNEYQIIISTTIIEVGVNVPNSTVIAIQNAERFGLSQLHQLRGRVGRGSHQSYCILMSKKPNDPKLEAMCQTTNGFKIAEIDLKLRGPGDFIGTKQSGQSDNIMLMLKYPEAFHKIRVEVKEIYKSEERLRKYRYLGIFEDEVL